MLHFSETGWTLPHMDQVSAEFDRDYDQDEYERKIGGLVGRVRARENAPEMQEAWDGAVLKVCDEDHYLLVLIDGVQSPGRRAPSGWRRLQLWLPTWDKNAKRDADDVLRLIAVALMLAVAIPVVVLIISHFL